MEEFVEMMIDGKKVKVSKKTLESRSMKQKKVEVEINGKKFMVAEHMVPDMIKFGASQTKRTVKNPPKELLNMPAPKTVILPENPVVEAPVLDLPDPNEIVVPKTKGRKKK